eukprot:NODE_4461_length_804_cov_380.246358_g4127_i0.p1 GENE.NODE_4461_length_804_cov_380.246358_g4127_i0~~NODE_4461_length_804_cov_380.246358_g4127_i0.p1  ORF type:complete len:205 (-),score=12.81 NODE_4461_length_804_cov_380.246358_g4127_i0:122-736(-)
MSERWHSGLKTVDSPCGFPRTHLRSAVKQDDCFSLSCDGSPKTSVRPQRPSRDHSTMLQHSAEKSSASSPAASRRFTGKSAFEHTAAGRNERASGRRPAAPYYYISPTPPVPSQPKIGVSQRFLSTPGDAPNLLSGDGKTATVVGPRSGVASGLTRSVTRPETLPQQNWLDRKPRCVSGTASPQLVQRGPQSEYLRFYQLSPRR